MSQIYAVLDCSGSMEMFIDRTISGFNAFIQSSDQSSELSLILFNDSVNVIFENKVVKFVNPLTNLTYRPHGSTALLDGIGKAIKLAEQFESKNWADDEKSIIILIMTDGQENSSKTFTKQYINETITQKKFKGWTFIFMGANQDAIKSASEFNIDEQTSLTFETENVNQAFRSVSNAIERSRKGEELYFTQTERTVSSLITEC